MCQPGRSREAHKDEGQLDQDVLHQPKQPLARVRQVLAQAAWAWAGRGGEEQWVGRQMLGMVASVRCETGGWGVSSSSRSSRRNRRGTRWRPVGGARGAHAPGQEVGGGRTHVEEDDAVHGVREHVPEVGHRPLPLGLHEFVRRVCCFCVLCVCGACACLPVPVPRRTHLEAHVPGHGGRAVQPVHDDRNHAWVHTASHRSTRHSRCWVLAMLAKRVAIYGRYASTPG
jgi:hypothetical protein